jgi:hypothetical protein
MGFDMIRRLPLILIFFMLVGCGGIYKSPEINVKVIDAETRKTIEDARVITIWKRIYSGPGGHFGGGVVKELRSKTGGDGSLNIPSYWLINYVPFPFGQGGMFYAKVYAHVMRHI